MAVKKSRRKEKGVGLPLCLRAQRPTLNSLPMETFFLLETLYGIPGVDCSNLSRSMAERDFAQLEKDLEQAVSKLKETRDPKLRRRLLQDLRRLLAEADHILFEPPD
jgi:hypothetical protein